MDIGTATGLQATAVGLGIGAVIIRAHEEGMAAVAQARADREQAAWEDRVVGIARAAVADLATANREIARLKAEVERLERLAIWTRLCPSAAR